MMLSGVGLVAKFKAEKSRKQKEEGKKRKKEILKEISEDVCEQCQIAAMRAKTHFQFPTRYNSGTSKASSGYGSIECDSEQLGDVGELVTISTGEGHYICVNLRYYTIDLQQGNSSSSSSYFRKRVLHREDGKNGEIETVVFSLDQDRDHYISTTKNKQLELNYFFDEPSLEQPDERFFLIYTTNTNQKIIQPFNFKNFYLHHLDNRLDVTRLDINFRAPEEYFFQFDAVPDKILVLAPPPVQVCTHRQTNKHRDMLPTKAAYRKENADKSINILSDLFMSCVGTRSRRTLELNSG